MSTFKHIYNEKLKAIAEQENIDSKDLKKFVENIDSHLKKIKELAKKGVKSHVSDAFASSSVPGGVGQNRKNLKQFKTKVHGFDDAFGRVLERIEKTVSYFKIVKTYNSDAKSTRSNMFQALINLDGDLKNQRKKIASDRTSIISSETKKTYKVFIDSIIKEVGQLLNKVNKSYSKPPILYRTPQGKTIAITNY